jgi:uncharacterized protein (DUF2384 family)
MTEASRNLSPGLEALRQRFQEHSRKAQGYYTVMHKAREITVSDEAASAWMEKSLPALDDKSPAMLVSEGREEELLSYIAKLKSSPAGLSS